MALKFEVAIEVSLGEEKGEPQLIVRPHRLEGNIRVLEPLGSHLWTREDTIHWESVYKKKGIFHSAGCVGFTYSLVPRLSRCTASAERLDESLGMRLGFTALRNVKSRRPSLSAGTPLYCSVLNTWTSISWGSLTNSNMMVPTLSRAETIRPHSSSVSLHIK